MTTELKKRVGATLCLLVVSRLLFYIPVPGVDFTAVEGLSSGASPTLSGTAHATIGALGILPYIVASTLVVLFFYFRRIRHNIDDRFVPVEFYTLILTGIIALLQGYGISVWLDGLPPSEYGAIIHDSGWTFRLLTMLSMAAGVYLSVWIATMITKHGIGNGVCLFILVNSILPQIGIWLKSVRGFDTQDTEHLMYIVKLGLLIVVFITIVLCLMHARRPLPIRADDEWENLPRLSVYINSVGPTGLHISQIPFGFMSSFVILLASLFPIDAHSVILSDVFVHGPIRWTLLAIVTFVATYWLAALAYDPRSLQGVLEDFNQSSNQPALFLERAAFDRTLVMVTLPLALAVPLSYIASILARGPYTLSALPLISFFAIAAITSDTYRQFNQHKGMAAARKKTTDDFICENCKHVVGEHDSFCRYCGDLFEKNASCEDHTGVEASAVCIICRRKLCNECCITSKGRTVCEAHRGVELLQEWSTVALARTRIEAELFEQRLSGISTLVHANTVGPIYGTLGLFDINPVTPLFVYRELAGGQIRVMVPIGEWLQAQKQLESS